MKREDSINLSRQTGLTNIATEIDFNNQTVVITGAGDGIGADEARAFHHFGAHVIGIDIQGDKLDTLQKELGSRFTPIQFDLSETDEKAYEDLGQKIVESCPPGGIDAYVMNAGVVKITDINQFNTVANTPMFEFHKLAQINAHSHAAIYQQIAGYLGFDARIVVTSSPIVGRADPKTAGYSVSKQMLESYANNILAELQDTDKRIAGYVPPPVQNFLRTDLKPKEPLHAHPHGLDIVELPLRLASRSVSDEFNGQIVAMGYDHLRLKDKHADGAGYDYLPRADDGGFAYDLRIRPIARGAGDEGDDLVVGYSTQPMRTMLGRGATPPMDTGTVLEDVYKPPEHIKKARAPQPR